MRKRTEDSSPVFTVLLLLKPPACMHVYSYARQHSDDRRTYNWDARRSLKSSHLLSFGLCDMRLRTVLPALDIISMCTGRLAGPCPFLFFAHSYGSVPQCRDKGELPARAIAMRLEEHVGFLGDW